MNKKFKKYVNRIHKISDKLSDGKITYLEDIEFLADREYKNINLSIFESSDIINKVYDILNISYSNKITRDNLSMIICGLIAVEDTISTSPICNNYLISMYDHCRTLYDSIKDILIIG